jgi:hypothetical protein
MGDTFSEYLKIYRENAKKELRAAGFAPVEDLPSVWQGPIADINILQWLWRMPDCRRDPAEIQLAIIDGLTQEGIPAWHGDATSIVEQIVRVQYDRAEKAEQELAALRASKNI